jgi:inorganic pyrophosphatase
MQNPVSNFSRLSDIDPGPGTPAIVRMIVEIPKNSTNKYEYDVDLGVFQDRVLYSPMHYPGDYGFIPGTKANDGDPMDILSLTEEPNFPGCMIEVRLVGVLDMEDEGGADSKILAVSARNPRYDETVGIDKVAGHVRSEIEHFFRIYKDLEGKAVRLQGWRGAKEAQEAVVKSREHYLSGRPSAP